MFNRRQFLTLSSVGAAGAAVAATRQPLLQPWNAGKSRSLKKTQDPVATVCVSCEARCPILAYRDNGRVVQVAPNPAVGPGGSICARAVQQLEALYDPERVLQPLKRGGRRGEGKWQPISWSEALEQMRGALPADRTGVWVELGRPDPLALPLLKQLGITEVVGWRSKVEEVRRAAERAVYGAHLAGVDLQDVRTVLLVGSQPWDNGPRFAPLAKALASAKVDGAEILYAGAYQGATGSLASSWIPLRPGSEAPFVLGLAHLLWREEEGARPPELEPYAPERVAEETGVSPALLQDLARRVRRRGPTVCLSETSMPGQVDAVVAATAWINAAGADGERSRLLREPAPPGPLDTDPGRPREEAQAALRTGAAIPLYLAYRANPVYRGGEAARRVFTQESRVGFTVAMDTHLTETAQLADLVLPAAADLELWNLFAKADGAGHSLVMLQQPAPRAVSEAAWLRSRTVKAADLFDGPPNTPLGEARQLGDVLLDLLSPPRGEGGECVARHVRRAAESLQIPGAGVLVDRRTEVFVDRPAPAVLEERPGVSTAALSAEDRRTEIAEQSFGLVVLHHPQLDPAYPNTRWGREVRRDNPVYVHRDVARGLGLKAGAPVTVTHGDRRISARAQPIDGIHPDAVALAADFGHWAGGMAATASHTPDPSLPPFAPLSRETLLRRSLGYLRQRPRPAEVPWWHAAGAGVHLTACRSDDTVPPVRVVLERT